MAPDVTTKTFDEEVLSSAGPMVVDFWAPWCGPCRAVAPVLEQIAEERAGALKVAKVNTDDEPELAARYGISSIPTIIHFANGEPVSKVVGAQAKAKLEKSLGLRPLAAAEAQVLPSGPSGFMARLRGVR